MKGRVYISGPITGTTDYIQRFDKAEQTLADAGYEVVNPARVNMNLPESTTHQEYMEVSFTLMTLCDTVYMMKGWDKSNGCRQEFEYASRHGISITFEGGTCHGKQAHKSL